ncbi:MAG: NADH-quinone oxidoreductase subunit C [Pseudomonadota bacterium]
MKSVAPRMIDRDDSVWAPLLGDGVSRRPGIEVAFNVPRARLLEVIDRLRVEFEYQQLMEIAGADYPERAERFEVVYCLLSLTKNHRIRVHVTTDEVQPVPSVTQIWPVAGWLEREVYDMYGVLFDGNSDLRRILTDYGFVGHPLRKDFPQTGYVELRYSEEAKRVVYEPVKLAQDFRSFDFLSPWEGAQYVLPGDEKAQGPAATPPAPQPEAKGAPTPLKAAEISPATPKPEKAKVTKPKTSDSTAQTGAGKPGPDAGPEPVKKPRKPRVKKAPGGEA